MPTDLSGLATGFPSTCRVPDKAGCRPEMSFMSELLPQPEGPTTAMNSPCAISSVTSSMARTAAAPRPYTMETRSSSTRDNLLDEALLPRWQVLRGEDIGRLGLVAVLEGEADLLDRALEALHVDRAEAVLLHVGRDEVFLQRKLEALELDLALGDRVSLHEGVDRAFGVLDRVLDAADRGAHEPLHRLRREAHEVRVGDEHVAVQVDAVVAHVQHHDLVVLHAVRLEVHVGREPEPGDRVDLALRQHRLAHREADVLDLHLRGVDLVRLHEDRPLRVRAVGRGRAQYFALEVLRDRKSTRLNSSH